MKHKAVFEGAVLDGSDGIVDIYKIVDAKGNGIGYISMSSRIVAGDLRIYIVLHMYDGISVSASIASKGYLYIVDMLDYVYVSHQNGSFTIPALGVA